MSRRKSAQAPIRGEPNSRVEPSRATGKFTRHHRLLDSKDYLRVMKRGRRRSCPELVVFSTTRIEIPLKNNKLGCNLPTGSRLGITASRKVGNAVVRNRFKRRIRSWFRHRRADFGEDLDLIVIARPTGSHLTLDRLDERLSHLLDLKPAPERIR